MSPPPEQPANLIHPTHHHHAAATSLSHYGVHVWADSNSSCGESQWVPGYVIFALLDRPIQEHPLSGRRIFCKKSRLRIPPRFADTLLSLSTIASLWNLACDSEFFKVEVGLMWKMHAGSAKNVS